MKKKIHLRERSPMHRLLFMVVSLFLGINGGITIAQPIIPAGDGTNTQVNINGNQINITGGQISGDRTNLFHSFQEFGLSEGQIANFLSNPEIVNILGRISGVNPSLINGLIQVTGSNANLFLMNPAGIVFGANAALNIPADFTATTATSIGFNQGIFQAYGNNNYASLIGQPSYFTFGNQQAGSIINFGNLAVQPGQSLSLLGGTILNTGSLLAPQGNLLISAVPGASILRISQPGNLLSLEVNLDPAATVDFNPLSLPQLLTGGGNIGHANQVTVNDAGQVVLSGSGFSIENGDAIANRPNQSPLSGSLSGSVSGIIIAENATISAANNLTLVGSEIQIGEALNLLAGNTLRIRDNQNAFLARSGGNIRLEGREAIDIFALNSLNRKTPFQAGGDIRLVSQGLIATDAHFAAGGNFFITNETGDAGNFISYYDPIISANGNVLFSDYRGASLKI